MVHIRKAQRLFKIEEVALCTDRRPPIGDMLVSGTYFYMYPSDRQCRACDNRYKSLGNRPAS
jgi:hypothetical protein